MRISNSKTINVTLWLGFVAIALLLFFGTAHAGTATVTWTNPTARTDGSALTASQIASTKIEWGTCSGSAFGTTQGSSSAANAATSLVVPSLTAGTYCFRAATVDTAGNQSGWSNIVSKTVPLAPPSPPTIVTVSTVAYEFRLLDNGSFRLVRSGSVSKGAPCELLPGIDGTFGIAEGKVAICDEG